MKRITVLAVCAAVALAGCGQPTPNHQYINHGGPAPTTAPKVSPKTWHIAGFTVKEFPLPAGYKPNENREFVVGTTLLKMGSAPPYTVTWQSLTSKRKGIVLKDGCPADTLSAYADLNDGYNLNGGYAPGYAGFVCLGREQGQLVLVHAPDMKASVFPLPGHSKSSQNFGEYILGVGISGTADHPYLTWSVELSETSNAHLGPGAFDITTGKPVASAPKTSSKPPGGFVLTSPNGTRYLIRGNEVSRWNGSAFAPLGTIPNLRVFAVDNSGVVWANQPSASNVFADTIIRQVPGSAKTKSWRIIGTNILVKPGFVAYTPGESLDGPVKIFFPEADRTITIDNVFGQPFPAPFQRANDQIMITTSQPPVVIEVIPPS